MIELYTELFYATISAKRPWFLLFHYPYMLP